jgi:hypothetical protein
MTTITIKVHGLNGQPDHLRAIPCRYRVGALAVTPRLGEDYEAMRPRCYNVTHVPSGCTVNTRPLDSVAEGTDVVDILTADAFPFVQCWAADDPIRVSGNQYQAFGKAVHLALEQARLAEIWRVSTRSMKRRATIAAKRAA